MNNVFYIDKPLRYGMVGGGSTSQIETATALLCTGTVIISWLPLPLILMPSEDGNTENHRAFMII